MPPIVNVAAYHFANLSDLVSLRSDLSELCQAQGLRGTILLSAEGINLFVAGSRSGIDALLNRVRLVTGLDSIAVKESFSADQPFNRMLVKIKKEIIAFGVEGIDPRRYTSKRISAAELKEWLDTGEPITLLDTRNDFEVQSGTFDNALAIGVNDFRDFPAAVDRLPDEMKQLPVVTFCTGGIRCEKAAPFLERAGFKEVYQLDGGILKYFEDVGGAHYRGDCFVFDKRVALDPTLKPSGAVQCFACQAVLTQAEAASAQYVEGESCPRCYQSPAQSMAELIARRHAALRAASTPLPGSIPYDNVRPISVPLRLDQTEVLDFFDAMHTHLSRDEWRDACERGLIQCRGEVVRPGRIVRAGERLLHTMPATREPDVNAAIRILHEDDAIVVIDKPAPLPMHPCGRFNRNTLSYLLDAVYRPTHLRPVHRLDADTTGVVLFSKTRDATRALHAAFDADEVRKVYLALVRGTPPAESFECAMPLSRDPGRHGTRAVERDGRASLTRFNVRKRFSNGTALLEVELETGRTNQIRIHLASLGLPILGDVIYDEGISPTAATKTLAVGDPPLCLHAHSIEIVHPTTLAPMRFETTSPAWANDPNSR